MERYWQPGWSCQPLLSEIISYFLYLDVIYQYIIAELHIII